MMDSIICESGGNNVSFSESNFINRNQNLLKIFGSNNSSPIITPDDRLKRLKDELFKSINNIKIKREEIKILEKQLGERNQEIKQLKNDENKALVELSHFKEESTRLQSKVRSLEMELERIRHQISNNSGKSGQERYEEKVLELEEKNEEMQTTLEHIQTEFEQLNMKYNVILDEESEKSQKIQDLEKELEMLRKENQSLIVETEKCRNLKADREKIEQLEQALTQNQVKCDGLVKLLEKEKQEKQKQLSDIRGSFLFLLNFIVYLLFYFSEKINSSMQLCEKETKDSTNSCLKCKEYVTEIAKVSKIFFDHIKNIFIQSNS